MKHLLLAFAICTCIANNATAQKANDATAEITKLMQQSAIDWNNANLDGFISTCESLRVEDIA